MPVFFHIFPWHRPPNHTDCALERNTSTDWYSMFLHVIVLGGIPIESDLRSRLGTIWEHPKFKVELWCRGNFGRLGWIDRAVNELSHAGSWDVVDTSTRSLAILVVLIGIAMRLFVWLNVIEHATACKEKTLRSFNVQSFFYHFRQDFFQWMSERDLCEAFCQWI